MYVQKPIKCIHLTFILERCLKVGLENHRRGAFFMIYYDEIGKKCSVNSSPLQHGESLFPYHLIGSVDNGLPALMKWDRQGIFMY